MALVNGSRFKLVFSHWYTYGNDKCPIPNGLHPATVEWVKKIKDPTMCGKHLRIPFLDHRFQTPDLGYFFRHGNFIWHFCRVHSEKNLVTEEQVIDDGSVYYFPIEFEWSGLHILNHPRPFEVDGTSYTYYFKDTITPCALELLRSGKVKLLITNLIDATAPAGHIRDFEKIANDMGIASSNIVVASGNKLNNEWPDALTNVNLASGMLSLYQAVEQLDRYPWFSQEMGYMNNIVKPADLDPNKRRSKKFLCFNRSMNRFHRLAMAHIALKHDLLKDSIFSFVTNLNSRESILHDLSKFYSSNKVDAIADQIINLVPYELDTQRFSDDRKQGFATIGVNKKEWYEESYVHIISESAFDGEKDPFFSEKTWRPIMNLQPFLFVGNCNSLAKLKQLGFKTFHPYIDESYDSEVYPSRRIQMIEEEIKKLASKSLEELHEWYYSITDILLHNLNHLRTFKDYDPWEELYK